MVHLCAFKPNSEIIITYSRVAEKTIIDLEMDSIYVKDENFERIFEPQIRGDEAKKSHEEKGLGLYLAKKMLQLNNSIVFFKRISKSSTTHNGKQYSTNLFVIHAENKACHWYS